MSEIVYMHTVPSPYNAQCLGGLSMATTSASSYRVC